MVCNEIILGGSSILKIYHKDFNEASYRRILHNKKIGRCNLEFREYQVSEEDIDCISGWIYKREGLLEPDICPNPYGDTVCARMTHYIFDDKPSKIFGTKKNKYPLKISILDFIEMTEFIEKYTGIKIKNSPMLFGDILIFSACKIDIKATNENGVTVSNVPKNSIVTVSFKNKDFIVYSSLISLQDDKTVIDIPCKEKWNNIDIYIYSNGNLIYLRKNLYYIRNYNVQARIVTNKTIPLNKISNEYVIKEYSAQTISSPAKKGETSAEIIDNAAQKLLCLIDNEKVDTQIFFIQPGEFNKAFELIGETIVSANDTLWVFDSYFTDKEGILKSLDWLNIISHCKADKKNIVFYSNAQNNSLNIFEFLNEIKKDADLQEYIRGSGKLGISLYQTKSPIHDRFILVQNGSSFKGLIMGTSFNSLERNHYCLSKLEGNSAKTILTELKYWLNAGNVAYQAEV